MSRLQELGQGARQHFDAIAPDWAGVEQAVRSTGVEPSTAIAATVCSFGERNIEALIDSPAMTFLFPTGIVSTTGKKGMLGGGPKAKVIDFSEVRAFGDCEYTDDRGFGKYCIEFQAAGGILLGRLQWTWKGKRFKDNRREIAAVAEERDQFLARVNQLLAD